MSSLDHLTEENRSLLARARAWRSARFDPLRSRGAFLPPCRIRVLLVADGDLDFSFGPFGLRTFVETLLSTPGGHVELEITLGHLGAPTDDEMMDQPGAPAAIVRRIKQFKFDDPGHFASDRYDQVWLFGESIGYQDTRGVNAQGVPYPERALAEAELRALSEFMEGGGGLFATGDHGFLGICLSGKVPRVRSMRLWRDVPEVSMTGPLRNDTNRPGHDAGSEFHDQSDDVPQDILPKLYQRWGGIRWVAFPHPLLCGPNGIIRVLPDHPHEGECTTPATTDQTFTFAGFPIVEYPPGVDGSPRPLPEIIATSSVLDGTVSGTKDATQPHSFGAICAYDGHRAGVGRVVTDATWHHFVNVNLVGDPAVQPETDLKRLGFLASPEGQAHLQEIRTYHRNIALWLARPEQIRCMSDRICWQLLWHHRVLEAVMTRKDIPLAEAPTRLLYDIGRHARDVLEKLAGQCAAWRLALEVAAPFLSAELRWLLDPWAPGEARPEPDLPWLDAEPLLDTALGGALLGLREAFEAPVPDAERAAAHAKATESMGDVAARGAEVAVRASMRSLAEANERWVPSLLNGLLPGG